MHIHSNIRALRKRAGLTQQELAKQLEKTQMTVGDYERGRAIPPLPIILRLCEIFQVDLQTLIYHDIVNQGFATSATSGESDRLRAQLANVQRLNELQGHRLRELEREIRAHAPELARKLGL